MVIETMREDRNSRLKILNRLTLNLSKSNCFVLMLVVLNTVTKSLILELMMKRSNMCRYKYLGTILDTKLSFCSHLKMIKQLSRTCSVDQ